jgi:hypothetical protein
MCRGSKRLSSAVRAAETLLPGIPVEEGSDPRWQAIIAVGEFIECEPEPVWEFIGAWGNHPQKDLRNAIACVLLEHLLEHHFATYFPRVEALAKQDPLFGDCFARCWAFGQSEQGENRRQFDRLRARFRNYDDNTQNTG